MLVRSHRVSGCFIAVIGGLSLLHLAGPHPANGQPFTNTVIALENQKSGTVNWLVSNPARGEQIEGYASLTSVNRGGQIDLLVNTTNSAYVLEVFRIGWYGGAGGRQVYGPQSVPGNRQGIPNPDASTGLIECTWTNPFTLSIPGSLEDPTEWASGVYLAKLTGSEDGKQSYIIFAVRDDARPADFLVQMSFTTYEAYNNWGGASLYDYNSPAGRAAKVSFNRPFAVQFPNPTVYWRGAGEFFGNGGAAFECNLVRWLEREGYDVSYCTSIDTHSTTNLLWSHKAFISVGHDEYWSYPMRWNVAAARDRGVNLAFLASNVCYWQVRFEPSPVDGKPDRTMVCYKSTTDPLFNTPSNRFTTVNFRVPPVLDGESSLVGVSLDTVGVQGDLLVNDPGHWLFSNTGFQKGQRLPGLLGPEVDSTNVFSPAGIQVACASPLVKNSAVVRYSEAASYTSVSGSTVFASGSMQWSWGLDDFNAPALRESFQSPAAQQATRNLLARLANAAAPSSTLFFRKDLSTVGDWKPRFGLDGYVLPNDSTNLPAYVSVDSGAALTPLILSSSLDTNSLVRAGSTNRYLSGWTSPTNFLIDLNVSDTNNHQVAFYCWDADHSGRKQLVEVLDAATTNLLDQRLIGDFGAGQWWVWQIGGHVQFRFTRLSGPDCVANGLAFGSGGAAVFGGEDAITQGDWKPYYGAEGEYLAGDAPHNFSFAGHLQGSYGVSLIRWNLPTADPRAPEVYGSTNRIFAAWNNPTMLSLILNFTDNLWHQLAIYCLDADRVGRKQQVSLVDQGNNSVLDSRLLSDFGDGKYLVWNVRGAVKLRVQNLGPVSATVNGIFLDPPNQPPGIALTAPMDLQAFTAPTNIVLSADATDPDGWISQVQFYINGTLLGTATNLPFTATWTNALVGQYRITAVAVDNREAATTSASATILVDTPQGYQPPLVQVTSPLDDTTYQLPTTVVFTASIAYTSAPITSLQFMMDGVAVGPVSTNAAFTLTTGNIDAGVHAVQAVVTDAFGVVVASPANRITALPRTPSALFHGYDFTTQGTWEQLYGSEGFIIINSETNLAVYCTAAPVGDSSYLWAYSTSDPRALENPAGVGRLAGVWFAATNFLLDLNLFDGSTHRIALYCLDWDNKGRLQTIEVLDPVAGTLLDTRPLGNFESGVYLVWDLAGHVQFRFTRDPSSLAPVLSGVLLSGVFFDPPRTGPQVRLLAPTDSATFAISTPIQFSALAISGAADPSRVEFLTNGTLLGSVTTGHPYTLFWTNPPAGVYTVAARAVDTNGNSSVSAPASIAVLTNFSTALFALYDTNHLGNWRGNFGLQGFVVAGGPSNPPPWVKLKVNGYFLSWVRTSDPRALQSVSGGVQEAAAWLASGSLDVQANFADASFHRISLYFLDWDRPSETESVDVLDTVSGALLDHRDLPSLSGVYAVWDVKGQLTFHITRATIWPALLSGIFFDRERVLPLITIINPPNGAVFLSPTNIALSANAASDPRVSSVEFYGDGSLLGTVGSGPPYFLVWSNAPVGGHSLVAREVGSLDTADSPPISFTVLLTNSLAFLDAKMLSNGTLQLDAFGPAGQPIKLQAAATLDTNAIWLPLLTNTSASGRFQFIIPDPAVYQQRFYRMVRPQKHK